MSISLSQFEGLTLQGLAPQLSALTRHPTTWLEFSWSDDIPVERAGHMLSEWRDFSYRDAVLIMSAAQLVDGQGIALADALRFVADRSAADSYFAFLCNGGRDGFQHLLDPAFFGGVEVAADPAMELDVLDNRPGDDFWIASISHRLMGGSSADIVGQRPGDLSFRAEFSGTHRHIFSKIDEMSAATNAALSGAVLVNVSTAARCIHQRAARLGIEIVDGTFALRNLVADPLK